MTKSRVIYLAISLPLILFSLIVVSLVSSNGMNLWKTSLGSQPIPLKIEKGKGFHQILEPYSSVLGVKPKTYLTLYAKLTGIDRRIKQGRYEIGPGWSLGQAIEQLNVGANSPLAVALTPGLTLRQSGERLQTAGWIESSKDFIEAASGESARQLTGKETLEGLIPPDTYFFDGPEEAKTVVQDMHRQWEAKIQVLSGTHTLDARLRNGLTLYDTIVLASLVEKEAASEIEMATVASVFHNRLRKNWPMGSVATIRYALHDWERGENEIPVNLKSPFNTNRKPGLPPHPICLPSETALKAAISPPDTPYFFFVADGDGGTTFNITHEDHIRSARDYRARIKEKQAKD